MTWKPTDEMVEIGLKADPRNCHDDDDRDCTRAILIAAQPLIAEEATAPLKAELEASMAEIARLRLDLAEARAKAREKAAKIAENLDFHDEYDDVRIAAAIRNSC